MSGYVDGIEPGKPKFIPQKLYCHCLGNGTITIEMRRYMQPGNWGGSIIKSISIYRNCQIVLDTTFYAPNKAA
jgi:hypothetical protein